MGLLLKNLDEETRQYMKSEYENDVNSNSLYISPRLTSDGEQVYIRLLAESIDNGDDSSLAVSILSNGCLKQTEERRTRSGGTKILPLSRPKLRQFKVGNFLLNWGAKFDPRVNLPRCLII